MARREAKHLKALYFNSSFRRIYAWRGTGSMGKILSVSNELVNKKALAVLKIARVFFFIRLLKNIVFLMRIDVYSHL